MKDYLKYEQRVRDTSAQDVEWKYSSYLTASEWDSLFYENHSRLDGLILEAGCGTGRFLRRIHTEQGRFVGTDLSAKSLHKAQATLKHNFYLLQSELTHLPFRSGVFDKAYCIGVLQAFLDREDAHRALSELARVLRVGGELALTTWNYQVSDRLKGAKVKKSYVGGINSWKYSRGELLSLLAEVFPSSQIEIKGIIHFHRKPFKIGASLYPRYPRFMLTLDRALQHIPLSSNLAHLLYAKIVKHP